MQRDARQLGLMRSEREREREREKGRSWRGASLILQQTFQKREEKPEVGSIAH
jgi:hypothetical protein